MHTSSKKRIFHSQRHGINWWSWHNMLGNIESCLKSSTAASRI